VTSNLAETSVAKSRLLVLYGANLFKFWPQTYLWIGEARHFKFHALIDTE